MGQVMAGDASAAQISAFAVALRAKGETASEMAGLAAAMLEAAHRIDGSTASGRHRRHGWRPFALGQHLHHGCSRGGGDRRARGQARQPCRVLGLRHRRRARGAGRRAHPDARAGRRRRTSRRNHLLLRPGLPPRHAARGCGSTGDRRPDVLQLPGPAHQPGTTGRAGHRVRGCTDGSGDGAGLRRPWCGGARLQGRRRSRRADGLDHVVRLARGARSGTGGVVRSRERRSDSRRPWRHCAVATARTTRRSSARCCRDRSKGRSGTRCC